MMSALCDEVESDLSCESAVLVAGPDESWGDATMAKLSFPVVSG